MVEEVIDIGRVFKWATTNKIYVTGLILHEIENEVLLDFKGDFEINGSLIIGPIEQKTRISFKNMDDFGSYISAIDIDYDNKDVAFTGYV